MTHDPARLADPVSGASPALRDLLRSASSDAPTAAQLAALTHRLAPQLGAGAGAGATGAGAGAGGVTAAKAGLAVAVVAVVATVAGVLTRERHAPAAPESIALGEAVRPAETAVAADRGVAPRAVATPAVEIPTPAPRHRAPRARALGPEPAPAPAPPATTPPAALAEDEVAILGRAQRALTGGDARSALSLAMEHGERFPAGALVEEREAIAIDALVRLGRHGDARARFERFRARFPRSGYAPRLDRSTAPDR